MLMATAAAIIFALGGVHLVYTFFGEKFHPRDPAVHEAMQSTPLVITRQTTLWRAWIGFNASHSQGAILFGLVFGFLSLQAPALLFGSLFLGLTGFAMLAGYLVLARRYWFRVPLVGISLAMAFYVAAWILGVR
jgi:hypothetical protein